MVSGGLKLARSSSLNLKQIHSRRSKKKSKDDDSRGRSTSRTNAKAKGKARATEIGLGIGVGPHIQVTLHDDQNDDVEHQVPMMGDTSHNHTEDDEDDDDEPLRSSYESQDLPTTTTSIDHHSDDSATNIYGQYLASSPPQSPYLSETPLPPSSVDTPQTALPLGSATPTLTKATFAQMAEQQLQFGSFSHSDSRGMTEWAKLHSYNVKWEQKVSVAVQMDVHRETNDLLPNELKLVVMQVRPSSSILQLYEEDANVMDAESGAGRSGRTASTESGSRILELGRIRWRWAGYKTVSPTRKQNQRNSQSKPYLFLPSANKRLKLITLMF